jgi:16S rRNA G966 N2-methylase RsmD
LEKYWRQRHTLFARFDSGIQLDEEGWYSVTPEAIAHHVAHRLSQLTHHRPLVILDAFGGCGGNAMAFAQLPHVQVVTVDVDRSKLIKAAHNASLYKIPRHQLVLCECNALFILEHCYQQGQYVLDRPLQTPEEADALLQHMPAPVSTEVCEGYTIGGLDLLPPHIDVVFLDPPWGGVDYEVFGKHGYDLEKNMRIARPAVHHPPDSKQNQSDAVVTTSNSNTSNNSNPHTRGHGWDNFFDHFEVKPRNKVERQAHFNSTVDEIHCANGADLLALAAAATKHHWVLYDVPRNTSRTSLGQAALHAGYRGHVHWEEHFLNGRLKTVTCYLGFDWRPLTVPSASPSKHNSHEHNNAHPHSMHPFHPSHHFHHPHATSFPGQHDLMQQQQHLQDQQIPPLPHLNVPPHHHHSGPMNDNLQQSLPFSIPPMSISSQPPYPYNMNFNYPPMSNPPFPWNQNPPYPPSDADSQFNSNQQNQRGNQGSGDHHQASRGSQPPSPHNPPLSMLFNQQLSIDSDEVPRNDPYFHPHGHHHHHPHGPPSPSSYSLPPPSHMSPLQHYCMPPHHPHRHPPRHFLHEQHPFLHPGQMHHHHHSEPLPHSYNLHNGPLGEASSSLHVPPPPSSLPLPPPSMSQSHPLTLDVTPPTLDSQTSSTLAQQHAPNENN